ncbi:MAG: RNA polymerase factor sigma-54 [Nitrospirae bacterium]|nr:RNA polymerase factor sigma-54 [Nitrospirota bacterium]
MALEHRLELKLAQKLILTPQLQQSIKLLQLPQMELSQVLNQELMENPLLEDVVEGGPEEYTGNAEAQSEESQPEPSDYADAPLEKIFGFTTDDYFEDKASDGRDLGYFTEGTENIQPFEQNTKKPSLQDHLLWQLRLSRVSEAVCHAAEAIIANLDDDGYLQASLEEIAEISKVQPAVAEDALRIVKGFDPPGVGARDLQECLLLQLKPLNLESSLVEKILIEGFSELNSKKYKQLSAKFKLPIEDIFSAVKVIEGLEPRPGRNYSNGEPVYVVPDVFVEESEGKFVIILNDEGIPRLRLSNYYRKLLQNKKSLSAEERRFLKEKMDKAVWLFKSLDQRNKTIYRVTESILKFQEEFFRKGVKHIKPMTLKDMAIDIGIHESTVSRVTSNKYLQCPRGLFSFKTFFNSAVPGKGDVSSATAKEVIKEAVAGEDHSLPFNDKQLVEILKGKDITVAIRTVAKYRDELKIPSHIKRKKWF